ncbi:MAG: response regulator [Sphingomonadaceae bacterium]
MPKILVVDDDDVARPVVVNLLKQAGHRVIEACDGVEGVSKYEDERPDAVFMDITMPRMDGLNALVAIRRKDPKARVIMVTAAAEMQIAMTAIKKGARDYIVKPFKVQRILAALEKVLDSNSG